MLAFTVVSLQLMLGANPVSGVALVKRSGANRSEAMTRAGLVKTQLEAVVPSLAGVEDATDCAAKLPCLLKFARDRQWTTLVAVETATVFEEVIVSVRAYSVEEDGRVLESANVKTSAAALDPSLRAALVPIAAALKDVSGSPVAVVPAKEMVVVEAPTSTAKTIAVRSTPSGPPHPDSLVEYTYGGESSPLPRAPETSISAPAPAAPGGIGPVVRWVPLGLSAAIAAGGAIAFAASRGEATALRNQTLSDVAIAETVQRGKLLQTAGVAGLISGSVLAAGSLIFALMAPAAQGSVSVAVAPSTSGLNVALSGSFP